MVLCLLVPLLTMDGCARPTVRPLSAPVGPLPTAADQAAPAGATEVLRPAAARTTRLPAGPLRGVLAVSAGHAHTCALLTEGRVACWGENGVGQAGAPIVGDTPARPHLVPGLPQSIVEVAAGYFHSCALDRDGAVWCWGRPDQGVTRGTSTSVLAGASAVGAWMPNRVGDSRGALDGVRSLVLAPGSPVACAVGVDILHCWRPHNIREEGQITLEPRRWPGIERVVAGPNLLCGLVRGAERGRRIECANGADEPTAVQWPAGARDPVSVSLGTLHLCALDAAGSVLCWRIGVKQRWWQAAPQVIRGLGGGGAVAVSAGGDFACAAARDGSVGCFLAEEGGLEEETVQTAWSAPDQVARQIPGVMGARAVSAGVGRNVFGHGFACAVAEDTSAVCWGDDESGQLGGRESPSRGLGGVVTAPDDAPSPRE